MSGNHRSASWTKLMCAASSLAVKNAITLNFAWLLRTLRPAQQQMSAPTLSALSAAISVPLPHDGPRGRPFVPANLDRQHDQIVVARVHGAQVQPLHDRNPAPQQNLMRPRRRRAELLCRDVVDADQHDP